MITHVNSKALLLYGHSQLLESLGETLVFKYHQVLTAMPVLLK